MNFGVKSEERIPIFPIGKVDIVHILVILSRVNTKFI